MRNPILFMITITALFHLVFASQGLSKSYRWVDDNGNIRVTDYPPPSAASSGNDSNRGNVTRKSAAARQQVELYVTSWCPYCRKAEDFFRSKGIPFKSYDIEKDKSAAARKKKLDKDGGVPFAVINGYSIHGFNPEGYMQALR